MNDETPKFHPKVIQSERVDLMCEPECMPSPCQLVARMSYAPVAMIKTSWPKRPMDEVTLAHGSRRRVHDYGRGMSGESRSSTVNTCRKRRLELGWDRELSKPILSDVLLPTRSHLLKFPNISQRASPPMDQVFNCVSLWGTSQLKLPDSLWYRAGLQYNVLTRAPWLMHWTAPYNSWQLKNDASAPALINGWSSTSCGSIVPGT